MILVATAPGHMPACKRDGYGTANKRRTSCAGKRPRAKPRARRGWTCAQSCVHVCALYLRARHTGSRGADTHRARGHASCRGRSAQKTWKRAPSAKSAAQDAHGHATIPWRGRPPCPHAGATQPRCGGLGNRARAACTAVCPQHGKRCERARSAHRVTRPR